MVMGRIQQGTATFRKANLAFFAAGFNTFAILYSTQPLMPAYSKTFHISPAVASLSLSMTTMFLAVSLVLFGSLSEVWGRKSVMSFSMLAASILSILTALSTTYHVLLVLRSLQGLALGGLPAIAMGYLGEEMEPKSLGVAMGLYISGNSLGAVGGRLIAGTLTALDNWHVAMGVISLISLISWVIFAVSLPASQNFRPRPMDIAKLFGSLVSHLKDPGLRILYGIGFLLLGSNVALFNYVGYVLTAPPYSFSQTLVSFIFVVYLVGMFSSVWMAKAANKYGSGKVLLTCVLITLGGATLTLSPDVWMKLMGLAVTAFGFFGGHSIASSWVGRRALDNKAQASSLYLFFYYAGSSIGGTTAGVFWASWGWGGVVGIIAGFLLIALVLVTRLAKVSSVAPLHVQHAGKTATR